MTAYEQLAEAMRNGVDTVEIREVSTGKEGVADICTDGMVFAFYGASDGSDDKVISADDFNSQFEITNIIQEHRWSVAG